MTGVLNKVLENLKSECPGKLISINVIKITFFEDPALGLENKNLCENHTQESGENYTLDISGSLYYPSDEC